MNRKSLFKIVGLLAILGIAIGLYMYNKKASTASDGDADFTMQPTELLKEFEKDMAASNTKYIGKVVHFEGEVLRIEGDEEPLVTLSTKEEGFEAKCGFQSSELEKVKSIKVGDQVTIQGDCDGVTLPEEDDLDPEKYISFSRCALFDTK